jgi:pimeloyl-ACP methyl ester carboxylesterase
VTTYESTSRFADADGIRVHYHEAGDGPSLLIHGGAPGAYGWGNFGRNLEELSRTFRTAIVDLWKRLDEILARTLILWGRENRLQPFENAVFMLSRIKHSQLHVFGECGLWVLYERMTEFNTLVRDFLTRA